MNWDTIEILEPEVPPPAGLYGLALGHARPFPPTEEAAETLFLALLDHLALRPRRIEVDLRLTELHDVELFGRFEHPSLIHRQDDPFTLRRLGDDPRAHIQVVRAPNIAEMVREVILDTGWFSLGGYGVVLDDNVLIDRMLDGVYLEVVTREPPSTLAAL